jgi:hypothetical protein
MSQAPVSIRAELERRLSSLPDLERRPSRYGDSLSYFVGGREIAHFHGDSRMDVRLTREEIRRLKSEQALDHRVRTRGPSADWAEVHVTELKDIPYAISLVEEAIRANS